MKKQKQQQKDWAEQIRDLLQAVEVAREDLGDSVNKYRDGEDLERGLRCLGDDLARISHLADQLYQNMYVIPIRRMFSLDRMNITRQQYSLARAAGLELFTAKGLKICPVDDYEVYQHCCYENEEMVCFVDPDENPPVETVDKKTGHTLVRLRVARSPEELEAKCLRPEQRRFFEKYRPDALARFQ